MPGLDDKQVRQFQEDGYLIVRDGVCGEAIKPLIRDLEETVNGLASDAVEQGVLGPDHTFTDATFAQRFARLAAACREPNWIWKKYRALGKNKTPGVFHLRTHPDLLNIVESLIGPEILAHPQFAVRAKLPDHEQTEVPWHQDLGYLKEAAGDTLIVNLWLPLVPATAQNGCLQVIRGSHLCGEIPHHRFTDDLSFTAPLGIQEKDLPEGEVITCEVDVGDVLLTMERVVHRSLSNHADTVRWSIDTRYCQIGMPMGRTNVPGFVARSKADPGSVAKSFDDWIRLFTEAQVDLGL